MVTKAVKLVLTGVLAGIVVSCKAARHCQRNTVRINCVAGTGQRVYNTGKGNLWNPKNEEIIYQNDGWDCQPCCPNGGTSLPVCSQGSRQLGNRPRNDEWNGQNGGNVQNRPNGGNGQNRPNGGNLQHCRRAAVQVNCVEGRGERVYNTGQGNFWDPRYEERLNQNDGWNCTPCCPQAGTSLPICVRNGSWKQDVVNNGGQTGWRMHTTG